MALRPTTWNTCFLDMIRFEGLVLLGRNSTEEEGVSVQLAFFFLVRNSDPKLLRVWFIFC